MTLGRLRCHQLRERKAPGVLLETLQAEEFLANRLQAVPRRGRRRAPEDAADEGYQNSLSAAHSCALSPLHIAGPRIALAADLGSFRVTVTLLAARVSEGASR